MDPEVDCRWCGHGLDCPCQQHEGPTRKRTWGKYHGSCLADHVRILGDQPKPPIPLWTDATQLTPAARTLYARLANDTTRKDNKP